MALTPNDLLEPLGELTPDLFPGKDAAGVDTLLAAYLTDAYSRIPATIVDAATKDRAAAAWAYARAYRKVLLRLSQAPATITIANEGTSTILTEQIRAFVATAKRWESDFNSIVGDAPAPDDTPSAAATNQYVF